MHLICRKVNHQAGIFNKNSKTQDSTINPKSFGLLCPPGLAMSHVTEAVHAYLCGVVGCLRGEKPPLRKVGPPEQSQRDLRRRLARPRPSAVPKKQSRSSQTRVFHPSSPPKPEPHEHQPGHDFAQNIFDRCFPVAAARVGLRGCASPPERSQEG